MLLFLSFFFRFLLVRTHRGGRVLRLSSGCAAMKNSARGDSSTGSEPKAVEEACREASRTVEPCELCASVVSIVLSPTRILAATIARLSRGRHVGLRSANDLASIYTLQIMAH